MGKKKHFSQLMYLMHGFNEVIQTAVHTAELLVPKPIAFQVEMALEMLTNISHGYQ
jgi:hypothetical protein